MNNGPVFVVMANCKYYKMLGINIKHISKVYPNSSILVYDWGDENYCSKFVLPDGAGNATIIDWTNQIREIEHLECQMDREQQIESAIKFNGRFNRTFRQRMNKKFLKMLPNSAYSKRLIKRGIMFENMMMQKIPCMIDASLRIGDGRMVFLDADAFILKNIDEVIMRDDFDVAITVVESQCFEQNKCAAINTGVIFFGPNQLARMAFLRNWLDASRVCQEWLREQTSMVRMLQGLNPAVFVRDTFNHINVDSVRIGILSLGQEKYNNCNHESMLGRDVPCIVHLVNTAHNDKYFSHLSGLLSGSV